MAGDPVGTPEGGERDYSFLWIHRYPHVRGVRAVIPSRKDRPPQPRFDRVGEGAKSAVECLLGRLEAKPRLATRYEKLAESFLGMVQVAMTRVCHRRTVPSNTA